MIDIRGVKPPLRVMKRDDSDVSRIAIWRKKEGGEGSREAEGQKLTV